MPRELLQTFFYQKKRIPRSQKKLKGQTFSKIKPPFPDLVKKKKKKKKKKKNKQPTALPNGFPARRKTLDDASWSKLSIFSLSFSPRLVKDTSMRCDFEVFAGVAEVGWSGVWEVVYGYGSNICQKKHALVMKLEQNGPQICSLRPGDPPFCWSSCLAKVDGLQAEPGGEVPFRELLLWSKIALESGDMVMGQKNANPNGDHR